MVDAAPPTRSSKGILAVALVFALGVVFGAALSVALLRLQGGFTGPDGRRGGPPPGGGIRRMARDLDLDAEQRQKIQAIIERTHGTMRQMLDGTQREIRALLRPDQQEKFDRMRPPEPGFLHRGPPSSPPGEAPPPGRHAAPPPPPNP